MSMFTLTISYLTTSYLPWFMDLTLQVPMQYFFVQQGTFLPSPQLGAVFLGLSLFIFSWAISLLFSTSILGTHQSGEFVFQFSSVQWLSHVWLFEIPWTAACQASLSITNSQNPLKPMSIESVMPSNHLILCHPLLLLPPIPPSIRVFFRWVSSSHQVAKVLEFQL